GPPEPLLVQVLEAVRDLGVSDGCRFVFHAPPDTPDPPGQIHVLGHGVGGVPAGLDDRFAPPGADGAGHDGDGVDGVIGAAVEVLAGDVLDRLPVRQRVDAIADFDVTGHGANARVGEVPHQPLNGVLGEDRVGIEGDDDLAGGLLDA